MRIAAVMWALMMMAAPVWAAAATAPVRAGCHATFTVPDARTLATATPNARAFVDDFGATLATSIHSQTAGTVNVAVTAHDAKHGDTEVGVYTVSLRTGQVTDDDMEPAEDDQTASVRNKLLARHCGAK